MARVKVCPSCTRHNPPAEPLCLECQYELDTVATSEFVAEDAPSVMKPAGSGSLPQLDDAQDDDRKPQVPTAKARLELGWTTVEIGAFGMEIGRDEQSSPLGRMLEQRDLIRVSRRHAWIGWRGSELIVRDKRSANGTQVNGRPIAPETPIRLADGDRIDFSADLSAIVRLDP